MSRSLVLAVSCAALLTIPAVLHAQPPGGGQFPGRVERGGDPVQFRRGGGGPGMDRDGGGGRGGRGENRFSPESADRMAEASFNRSDRSGDGLLQTDEMNERLL